MTVNLDDGGIDHGIFHVGAVAECREDLAETISLYPATVALEYTVPVAKFYGQIAPWTAGADNP